MKKKFLIVSLLIIIILAAVFLITPVFGSKPFQNLSLSEISKVSVELVPPDVTLDLNAGQIEKLVPILQQVVIYKQDHSYAESCGQAVIFTITKTDGSLSTVQAYNPFLVIDGVGYKTKYEPCEALNQLGNQILSGEA
ncbi:MAG: hypothetical protein HFG18_00540 [Oscillospiraceae bacterium]|nr:hypothetical protein [Oscillospiraceae bacterium]